MNRRALVLASAGSVLPFAATAHEDDQSNILRRLIVEVIGDRYMRNLGQLVAPNVVVRSMSINTIQEFQQACEDGRMSMSEDFSEIALVVVSVAENEEWAHALVRYGGERSDGTLAKGNLFYAAYFADGLISHLYLG
jgi:hypothetical protein